MTFVEKKEKAQQILVWFLCQDLEGFTGQMYSPIGLGPHKFVILTP